MFFFVFFCFFFGVFLALGGFSLGGLWGMYIVYTAWFT